MNNLNKMAHLNLHLPTYVHVSIVSLLPQMASDISSSLLTKLRLCSCGTKPQHSRNHWYQRLCNDIIMRTPMSS